MIYMSNMAVPDLISDVFDPTQNQLYQPDCYGINNYDISLTLPESVISLSDFIHPLSDFRPEKHRDLYGKNSAVHPSEALTITEDSLSAFKQCYNGGSIDNMIEEQGFSPPQYLGLFFVSDLESAPHMTATVQDKENLSLFLEWAHKNRDSFDVLKSTHNIKKYLEDISSAFWSRTPESIYLDDLKDYISNQDSYLDRLNMLDKLVKSKDIVQEFDFFKDINQSVRNYLHDNMDADILFNTLKQKHQNEQVPNLFIDVYRFSEKWDLLEKYKPRLRNILELFSASYLKRDIYETLDGHKSDLQEIYEDLGGNRELFPYYEHTEKPSDEGVIIVRTRGFKNNCRKSGSGMTRLHIHKK